MSLKIDVGGAGNAYARQVMNECHGLQGGSNAPHVAEQPVQGAAEDRRPADGVLMRALRQIRRESGPMHAAYLADVVVSKDVNLNLAHFDEVDGGVSTRAMDEGWVDVDFASDIGKPEGGSRDDAFAVRAQQTMAALEQVSVDDVRATYADFLANLPAGMDENRKKAELRKLLTETGGNGVRGKITDAIKAELQLQNGLLAAHIRQVEQGLEPDRALIAAIRRSALCANSLIELVTKVAMAPDDAAHPMESTVTEALGRKMLQDGSGADGEMTEKVVRIFDGKLADLNRLYGNLSAENHVVTAGEFRQLEDGLAEARKMLADAQDGVVLTGGGDMGDVELLNLDRGLLRQLEARIGEMSGRIEKLKLEALGEATREIFDEFSFDLLESPLFDKKYADLFVDRYCENKSEDVRRQTKGLVADFRGTLEKLKKSLGKGLETGRMDEAHAAFRALRELICTEFLHFSTKSLALDDYIRNAQVNPGMRPGERLRDVTPGQRNRLCDHLRRLTAAVDSTQGNFLLDRVADMVRIVKGGTVPVVNGALLAKVMDGSCGLSTAALTVAWGEDETLIRPGIDDRHLISSKTLGSGACNTVMLCSYRRPDGSTQRRVFKPEIPARFSLARNNGETYETLQTVSRLNVSVCRVAKLLGLDNRVADAHAGVHGGQFGLMMELADGITGKSIGEAARTGDMDKRVGQKTLRQLQAILDGNGPDAKKLIGNLRHALTDLDWLDHIVGQTDRHHDNYMISVGEDLSVSLKGIDNDMSFSQGVEAKSDSRAYPPVISRRTYDGLQSLVNEIDGKANAADVRRWLRESERLGMTGLTDAQLDKTVERIRSAWAYASSPDKCTIIENEADWGDRESLQRQAERPLLANERYKDYFTRDVVRGDMLFRAGLSNDFFPALNGSEANQASRSRFIRMKSVMNMDDESLKAMMPQPKENEQPVSVTELRAFFTVCAQKPLTAARVIEGWPANPGDLNDAEVVSGLVKACRKERDRLVVELQKANISLEGDELESYVPVCFTGKFGEFVSQHGKQTQVFRKEFAVIYGHPAFARPEIRSLFKFGGGFDWVSFLAECKDNVPGVVDEAVIAEALMSELGKDGFNPAEMDVSRLRRLVANKFNVTPRQVPGMPATLSKEEETLFRTACAVTPAGAEYYANVKAKYDELKGSNG